MQISNQTIGNLSMLIYVIITVVSTMLIHDTNQSISPFLSAFYTFAFCVFAYSYSLYGLFDKHVQILKNWFNIAMLNLTTAIVWIFSFLSLKYIPPELFLFIFICAMPIVCSLIDRTHLIRSILFLVGLVALSSTYQVNHLILGFVIAFTGGAAGAVYSIYSKKLISTFSTMEILSLRFFLTVIITLIVNVYLNSFHAMGYHFYTNFVLLSLVSVILPLIFFQIGIKNLDLPHAISYLPLAPLLCYINHMVIDHSNFNLIQLVAVIILFLVMMFNFMNLRREN